MRYKIISLNKDLTSRNRRGTGWSSTTLMHFITYMIIAVIKTLTYALSSETDTLVKFHSSMFLEKLAEGYIIYIP